MKPYSSHTYKILFIFWNLLLSLVLIGGAFWKYADWIRPIFSDLNNSEYQIDLLQNRIAQNISNWSSRIVSLEGRTDSVVYLETSDRDGNSSLRSWSYIHAWGNGFLIWTGYLISNAHVFDSLKPPFTALFADGKRVDIDSVHLLSGRDLAIAHLVDVQNWYTWFLLHNIETGAFVYALSISPESSTIRTSRGVITNTNSSLIVNQNSFSWLYQLDLNLFPGESGSPLFDMHGNLIWINTAITNNPNGYGKRSYAIPLTSQLFEILTRLYHK